MEKYLYSQFEPTEEYRRKVIEFLRHNTNAEIGGYRLYDGTGTHYMQNPVEITDFVFAVKEAERRAGRKFESFLEVGFSAGINNTFLNKMLGFTHIVAVDFISPFGMNPATFVANLRFKNLTLICGNSMDPAVVDKARRLGPYDLIFIDGGHEYGTVAKDFENYAPMLREAGVLALHDIYATDHPGPGRLWVELRAGQKDRWEFQELYDAGNHTDYGIGMLVPKSLSGGPSSVAKPAAAGRDRGGNRGSRTGSRHARP